MLVFGIPGVTWEDIELAEVPTLDELMDKSAVGNVSGRISNKLSEAYASLGAAERTQTDASSGWAFNRDELIEHGTAEEGFRRRNGSLPHADQAEVLVFSWGVLTKENKGRAFNSTPGLLGAALAEKEVVTAVVGNADFSNNPLPNLLPTAERMGLDSPPETGIHREAALAASTDGGVPLGAVSRDLLIEDAGGAFGIATSQEKFLEAFLESWAQARLVVVESGDTFRADAYSLGLPEERRAAIRRVGLQKADRLLSVVLGEIRSEVDLIIVLAATTPGGPKARAELRPMIVAGPGGERGLLTSGSTRRSGIVTMSDVGATIATFLGVANGRFGGGNAVEVEEREGGVAYLVDANAKAVVHDKMRTPVSAAIIGLQLILYSFCIFRILRGKLSRPLVFLLMASLAVPLASYSSVFEAWRFEGWFASGVMLVITLVLAATVTAIFRHRDIISSEVILGATVAFFMVDLSLGAPSQLDSQFGYTSVAAGRFFGLGNLGFALFAAAALLLAGSIASRRSRFPKVLAMGLVVVATAWIGLPRFGADAGGTLAMVPATITLAVGLITGGRVRFRYFPLIAVAAAVLFLVFGAADLMRAETERTHLGNFLAQAMDDPYLVWVVARRKLGLAASLAIQSRWGLALPGAVAVLAVLHRRERGRWREILVSRPSLRVALDSLIVAAVVGSLVNDSGVAVAGMMLAIAAPWALIVVSAAETTS